MIQPLNQSAMKHQFPHDLTARNDPKMQSFVERTGAAGYGIFWILIEMLRASHNRRVPFNEQTIRACTRAVTTNASEFALTKDQVRGIIAAAIDEKLLCVDTLHDEPELYSQRVEREEAQDTPPPLTVVTPITSAKKYKTEKYRTYREVDFQYPDNWDAEARQSLKDWVQYKADIGDPSILKTYQQKMLSFRDDPTRYTLLVRRAIGNGWKGLNEQIPFEQPVKGQVGASGKSRAMEVNLERIRRLEEQHTNGHDRSTSAPGAHLFRARDDHQ